MKKTLLGIIHQEFVTVKNSNLLQWDCVGVVWSDGTDSAANIKHTHSQLSSDLNSYVCKLWLAHKSMWHLLFPTQSCPLQTIQKSLKCAENCVFIEDAICQNEMLTGKIWFQDLKKWNYTNLSQNIQSMSLLLNENMLVFFFFKLNCDFRYRLDTQTVIS